MTARPRRVTSRTVGPTCTELKALIWIARHGHGGQGEHDGGGGIATLICSRVDVRRAAGGEDEHSDQQSERVPEQGLVAEEVETRGQRRRGELDGEERRENTHSDQGDDPAADREQQIRCSGGVDLRPEAADEVLPNLTRDVVGDMLGTKRGAALTPGGRISYHLSVKDLTGLTVPGSGEVTAPQITAGAPSCDISGSGTITVGGTVGEQELTISGSGSYEPVDSPARLCAQTFRGAGTPW